MGLGDAAVEAVKQWKYEPATLHGEPLEVYYNLTAACDRRSPQSAEPPNNLLTSKMIPKWL